MKKTLRIQFTNGEYKDLELSKAVSVNSQKEFIYVEPLRNGTWRISYTENLFPEISEVDSFKIIRE